MKRRVIITAGGTREDIDEVRFLTNVSTGKLGALIADFMYCSGFDVRYVCTETSEQPIMFPKDKIRVVRSTSDAYQLLKGEVFCNDNDWEFSVQNADAIIHAMACGDFGFKPLNEKIKSNSADAFIESLRERIIINPKILKEIKKWNPNIFLVSFKFETGETYESLCEKARASMESGDSNLVIANDKKMMTDKNSHVAFGIRKNPDDTAYLCDKEDIARFIIAVIKEALNV